MLLSTSPVAFNTWYILRSSDNAFLARQFGISGGVSDTPVPADYSGDGKTDLAVYELSDGIPDKGSFKILQSPTETRVDRQWGFNVDRRVQADYDGDGKVDLAVFRTNNFPGSTEVNTWYILQSSNGIVRVERSNGFWYRLNSKDGSFYAMQFGASEDKPTPADYDGDGKTDIAVFRPSNGKWYLQRSTEGFAAHVFGFSDDIPIPNVYVR